MAHAVVLGGRETETEIERERVWGGLAVDSQCVPVSHHVKSYHLRVQRQAHKASVESICTEIETQRSGKHNTTFSSSNTAHTHALMSDWLACDLLKMTYSV